MDISNLSIKEKSELLAALEAKEKWESENKFFTWFPDETRHQYQKHIEYLNASKDYKISAFLAANRIGKSTTSAYLATMHATGEYPWWYSGKRFDTPVDMWIVGKTAVTVRDIMQLELLGPQSFIGTGFLPKSSIVSVSYNNQRADQILVKHKSGGISAIGLKSSDSGFQTFMGTKKQVIIIDEECDSRVFEECLLRTLTCQGIVCINFTSLLGVTELVNLLVVDGDITKPRPGVKVVTCAWSDVPHLSPKDCEDMLALLPPFQRLCRSTGIIKLGAGVCYPVDPDTFVIPPFEIPKHFHRLGSLDVGWKITAACWFAIDPDSDSVYIYSEYYSSGEQPIVHAEALKARGKDIPFVIDGAAHGVSQIDGRNLFDMYRDLGLNLRNANKAVNAGIYAVWEALTTGKLKIFSTCTNLLSEMRLYRRDESGKIVKTADHLMDSMRYGIMGLEHAKPLTPKIVDSTQYSVVSHQYRTSF